MFQSQSYQGLAKSELYALLAEQLPALLEGEPDPLANMANAVALIYHALPEVNWVGCYRLRKGELVLGPFQGKPACTRIALGKGACGLAAAQRRTVVAPNVHEFPGHIACDAASRSEIVAPLVLDGCLLGVLDLDSPVVDRFDAEDRKGVETLARILAGSLGFCD